MTNPIAQELTELAARDQRMRAKLLAAGVLHDGYHPQMEAVHRDNAEHLEAITARLRDPDKDVRRAAQQARDEITARLKLPTEQTPAGE